MELIINSKHTLKSPLLDGDSATTVLRELSYEKCYEFIGVDVNNVVRFLRLIDNTHISTLGDNWWGRSN